MNDNDRGCNNCAWGKLVGEEQICLAKFKHESHLGQPACDDGEVWCDQWNSFQLNLHFRQQALTAWRKTDEPKQVIQAHQEELFGPIEDLHK